MLSITFQVVASKNGECAMALFDEKIIQKIGVLLHQRHQEFSAALGKPAAQETTSPLDEQIPLWHELQLLIQVANGEYVRAGANKALVQQVESALKHLVNLLLGNALYASVTVPDEFWDTDIGVLISRVRWWISVDDLITISNAAALAFGENTQANRMRIARAIDNGLLEWIPDPSVSNPQQNRRVLRPQVERLREQSRLSD
jgi:hypothetical protein